VSTRWRGNRAVVAPPGSVEVDVPRSHAGQRAARARLSSLAAGTPVVLCAAAPFARRRIFRTARAAGVELRREYLAFPSAAAPAYLVDDERSPIRLFIEHALVVPPGMRVPLPVSLGVTAARRLRPARLLRLLAPGRLAVGRAI
jgi:hypothetical protein